MQIVFQIVLTVIGAFLSVVLTKFLIQNGRMLAQISQRIDEGLRKMDEGFRKMDEGFRKMDERTAKIAELIVLEADKTRELIKTMKA